jgi:hypothetical protein
MIRYAGSLRCVGAAVACRFSGNLVHSGLNGPVLNVSGPYLSHRIRLLYSTTRSHITLCLSPIGLTGVSPSFRSAFINIPGHRLTHQLLSPTPLNFDVSSPMIFVLVSLKHLNCYSTSSAPTLRSN